MRHRDLIITRGKAGASVAGKLKAILSKSGSEVSQVSDNPRFQSDRQQRKADSDRIAPRKSLSKLTSGQGAAWGE